MSVDGCFRAKIDQLGARHWFAFSDGRPHILTIKWFLIEGLYSCGTRQCRKDIHRRHDLCELFACGDMTGPAHNGYYPNTAFECLALAATQRRVVSAPNGVCGTTVITKEKYNSVFCDSLFIKCIQYLSNSLVHGVHYGGVHRASAFHADQL